VIDLRQGDCLEIMKSLSNESIDLVVTDPPYKVTSRGCSGTMGGYWKNEKAKSGLVFDFNDIKCEDYIPELYRVLKDKTICYIMCNNKNLQEMINVVTKSGFKFVKSLIWDKGNKICGRYYMGCYEYILMFRKGGDKPINNCGTPDILSVPIKKLKDSNGKNLHDTEKPVELMQILIENSSKENEVVLDPFMGIGATGLASMNTNRNFIGIELDEKYFKIAKERIEKECGYEIKDSRTSSEI
jgi:site-specific DNA-methyltransferase (adenine-specific)